MTNYKKLSSKQIRQIIEYKDKYRTSFTKEWKIIRDFISFIIQENNKLQD